MWSARNGSTCFASSERRISCCHSSIRSGCEANPCQYFGKEWWNTQLQCADALSANRTWSRVAILPKTKGTVIAILSGSKSRSCKSARNFGNGSDSRSVEARQKSTWLASRTESSCTTLGRRYVITVKNTLTCISTWQAWFRKHSNIERCLKNLELLNQPRDQKLIDFDKERQNFYEKYETWSLQRNLQITQDSLNSWTEVILNSNQRDCVDESVATSTSSVNRTTEQAISYLPQVGSDPELFLEREHKMPKAPSTLAASLSTSPASISKPPVTVHHSSSPTTPLSIVNTEVLVTVPACGGPQKREKQRQLF